MKDGRTSGILMHITSLPSRFGIGDLGPEAYRFVDFLAASGQSVWQILPIVPVGFGDSPYASPSTFAGNTALISPELLQEHGLLDDDAFGDLPTFPTALVDFEAVRPLKSKFLNRAFSAFLNGRGTLSRNDFDAWCNCNSGWVDDYALFLALKSAYDSAEWMDWPTPLALRQPEAIVAARSKYVREIEYQKFSQFVFDLQWHELKKYCNAHSVEILGDLPIYVAQDSADVWSNPELFHLDDTGRATVVSGVPPDYFSETGQLWGNPIYRWDRLAETGYKWWIDRMARILDLVDIIRLDHFRGFEAFWQVSVGETTAINGKWVEGPGSALFDALHGALGDLPIVAENLGVITEGVTELMKSFHFPGMSILQFAFDSDMSNEFLPHNLSSDTVAYTGTHDNDTFLGWWTDTVSTQDTETIEKARQFCREYLNMEGKPDSELTRAAIGSLMDSVARLVVTPMQDLLELGADARMNTPGTVGGRNWGWRMKPEVLSEQLSAGLLKTTRDSKRVAAL